MKKMILDVLNEHEECDVKYITECQTKTLVGIRNGQPIYETRTRDEAAQNTIKTNEEKAQLEKISALFKRMLQHPEYYLDDTTRVDLQIIIRGCIKRCVEVGYQGTGLEFIELLANKNLTSEKAPIKDLDQLISGYIADTVRGYAKRAILDGGYYKDRVLSIITDCESGKYGEYMKKMPADALAIQYNRLSTIYMQDEETLVDKDLNPQDQITEQDLAKYTVRTGLSREA